MRRRAGWEGKTARYGAAGESAAWRVVYDHYEWDRLREAYEAAQELGAGSGGSGLVGFRTIEAEWLTRESGQSLTVRDWLTVEAIESELPVGIATVGDRAVEVFDSVAARFGFEHGPPVMLTVMAVETDVPWIPGRFGYCIGKHPFAKVCIPNSSLHDEQDFVNVLEHEYAHVVSLNLSDGRAPVWLDEAMAMVSGGGWDARAWRLLASGTEPWLEPEALSATFRADREDAGERHRVWLAYQQSSVIGRFLAGLKGERSLAEAMRGLANNSFWRDLWVRISGLGPSDEALREVYGTGTREVFKRAHSWLRTTGRP